MRKIAALSPLLLIGVFATCTETPSTAPVEESISIRAAKGAGGPKVKTVSVSPGSASIAIGATVQLTGTSNPAGFALAWSSSNGSVASVTQSGLVTGLGAGIATISATAGGKTGRSTITVTAPPPPGVTLLAAGDISTCTNNNDEATAQLLDANPQGLVALLGDNVYDDGTKAEYDACYHPTWGRHKSRTMPSAGNHEYNTPNGAGYYEYFGSAAGDPAKGYYSYDHGDWHIIVLNSNIARDGTSAQIQWLRGDLAANVGKACTLAYWHHPRFSSALHGNNSSVQTFWDVLYEFDADVILAGHDHSYERFAPQTGSGAADAARGIRGFVVGTGGRSHYALNTLKANSEVFNGTTYGILKLTLSASSYTWQFLPVAGQTFTDSGTASCH